MNPSEMTGTMNPWEQYKAGKLEKCKVSIGTYNAKFNYTPLHCQECEDTIEFPRELSEATYVAGHGQDATKEAKKEWTDLNNAFNTYCQRHKEKCEPPPPPSLCKFQLSDPIKEWTDAGITEYLLKHKEGNPLPELFAVEDIHEETKCCNQKAKCLFYHPDSGLMSDSMWINSALLSTFSSYNQVLTARLQRFKEEKEEAFVQEFVHDILDRCIYTVEKETEHIKKPARKKVKLERSYGKTEEIRQDALYVYKLLMTELKNHPGQPLILLPEIMKRWLEATFYHEPRVKNMMWGWNGEGFVGPYSGVKALLLYKPHALQAWLLLCKQTGGAIRLVVDEDSSKSIENDMYGFTQRPIPLRFKASGDNGVVCAVLCHGDVDPTEVYDRSLVLPLATLGGDAKGPTKTPYIPLRRN